jgi:hypothetical protein
MLNLNSIMIGTAQVTALGTFYAQVIGRPADSRSGPGLLWLAGRQDESLGHAALRHGWERQRPWPDHVQF